MEQKIIMSPIHTNMFTSHRTSALLFLIEYVVQIYTKKKSDYGAEN